MIADKAAFIRANTRIRAVPLAPEISLYLADEAVPLWQKTEEDLGREGLPPPFWAFAWAGGQGLARYVLDNPHMVRGRTVIDFATGSGLVAIAAGLAGAARVVCSDLDPFSEEALKLNALENGQTPEFCSEDLLAHAPPVVDVILAGDVFYERSLAERVVRWLGHAKAQGSLVIVGDPDRSYFPHHSFRLLATYEIAVSRDLEDKAVKRTGVYTLKEPAEPVA
jgi:predicted nicotinamide N-methyase